MQIQRLQEKKENYEELKEKLIQTTLPKIKSNTKAYFEIKIFLNELISEINFLDESIKTSLQKPDKYIDLKIHVNVMQKLFNLKNMIPSMSFAVFFEFILDTSGDLLFAEHLTQIRDIQLNKKIELLLSQTDFYVCKEDKEEYEIIVYKIDDLIIYEDSKYLNLENFEKYSFNNRNFLFSSNYTLIDIKKFKVIW
jgi:hypothetical protein